MPLNLTDLICQFHFTEIYAKVFESSVHIHLQPLTNELVFLSFVTADNGAASVKVIIVAPSWALGSHESVANLSKYLGCI